MSWLDNDPATQSWLERAAEMMVDIFSIGAFLCAFALIVAILCGAL